MMKLIALLAVGCAGGSARQTTLPTDTNLAKRACGGGVVEDRLATPVVAATRDKPRPDIDAKEIVHRMVEAHGGVARWRAARAFEATHILMFGPAMATEWFVSSELTELSTRRTSHDWPLVGARMVFDGQVTWTRNWKLDNPPGLHVNSVFEVLTMPWLAATEAVSVERLADRTVARTGRTYYAVEVQLAANPVRDKKHYKLLVEPGSFRLIGVEFEITYGAFLDLIDAPKGQQALGPFLHLAYEFQSADGLLIPMKYDTFGPDGSNSGRHVVISPQLKSDVDPARFAVDTSFTRDASSFRRK